MSGKDRHQEKQAHAGTKKTRRNYDPVQDGTKAGIPQQPVQCRGSEKETSDHIEEGHQAQDWHEG
jgi:hypothetical protein